MHCRNNSNEKGGEKAVKNSLKKWVTIIISMAMLAGQSSVVFAEGSTEASAQIEQEQKGADEESVNHTVAEETQKQIEMPTEQAETVEAITEQKENAVENLEQQSSGYYLTLDGLTWVYRSDYIDVGTAYSTNDPYVQFKWEMYNVNTGQWSTIANWNYGNWASWKTDCGDYWLHCTARTSDGAIERTNTIGFHYVAGNTQISGIYAGNYDVQNRNVLLGCNSTSSETGITYSFKIYDVESGAWSSISEYGAQWVNWKPEAGTYWIHYELYTKDRRLADTRTISIWIPPVRRALLIGNMYKADGTSDIAFQNDVNNMEKALLNATMDGLPFCTVDKVINQDKSTIINQVCTTFQDTTEGDISYIFISCHGDALGNICMDITDERFSPQELRELFEGYIKGKVVVMVTSCYSGNLIQSSALAENNEIDETEEPEEVYEVEEFCQEFVNAFLPSEPLGGEGILADPKYVVVCAAGKDESSWRWIEKYSIPVYYWLKGCGWDCATQRTISMQADNNGDGKVTLSELHNYAAPKILNTSAKPCHEVVYPENSDFVIYSR